MVKESASPAQDRLSTGLKKMRSSSICLQGPSIPTNLLSMRLKFGKSNFKSDKNDS